MASKNEHSTQSAQTQNQTNPMSDDTADDRRRTDKSGNLGTTGAEKPHPGDPQNQPTPEEFGERGMGMAAKE